MAERLTIKVTTVMPAEGFEKLEEDLRDLLRARGIFATIEDSATGNTTTTTDREDEDEGAQYLRDTLRLKSASRVAKKHAAPRTRSSPAGLGGLR